MARLVPHLEGLGADLVVSPALGGIVFGFEVARQLGLPSLFVERISKHIRQRDCPGITFSLYDRGSLVVVGGPSNRLARILIG